ncbi:short-chain dehydrogenase [Umbelopsis sp. PMI_123]|nr:short-chain dehydrogenase [Umbelopsis sp. PMI_123]
MTTRFNRNTTSEEAASELSNQIKGKTVIITGASWNGLGAEAARVIAKHDPKLIILAGRKQESLDETIQKTKEETPNANIRSLILDLTSLESVRQAAKVVNSHEETIDVLINNAGIMATPYSTTKDGFELQFGTNHLGHFLFTALIFPRIMATKEPRIVNVTSFGHNICPILFDDPGFTNGETYSKWNGYGQSKTANVLFSRELANRYGTKGLTAFSLHPGAIITSLGKHIDLDEIDPNMLDYYGNKIPENDDMKRNFKTLQQGTSTHIIAAFDPSIKNQNGAYLQNGIVDNESVKYWAKDDNNASKLWELSEQLVGHKFDF